MLNKKIEHIKELLSVPCEERTEKMCLELMSFTKVRNYPLMEIGLKTI